jgi:alpha-ketoglutaric semialdehyde dehydrogenase
VIDMSSRSSSSWDTHSGVRPNLIAGHWRDGVEALNNVNPSDTRDLVGRYAIATAADVGDAMAAARAAQGAWAAASPLVRADVLDRVAQALIAQRPMLAELLAREEGKTLAEAVGEVTRAAHIFRFFSAEAVRPQGETGASVREGVDVFITREPLGVVGLITPWNFPIAIPAWKIAPALAFGNTVVFKPAEWTPGCAWELARLLHEAGVPPGVFNLVMGPGAVTGSALMQSHGLDALSFTGSQATGQRLGAAAFDAGMKFQLEMGGKNPLVVADDADLDVAVDCAVQGGFFSTGQRCTASSRVIVTRGIHDVFVERLIQATRALRVGAALDAQTQIGPVVHERQLEQVLNWVNVARGEGAECAVGGQAVEAATPGHYMAPAVLLNATPAMRSSREEIFGPVVSVLRAQSYDEALALANDTEFGLTAGIVTRSLATARHFQRHARAGMVMVNVPTAGVDFHVPFGGSRGSSHGAREQGTHAREFYTQVKTAYVR